MPLFHIGFGVVADEIVKNREDAGFEDVKGDVIDGFDIGEVNDARGVNAGESGDFFLDFFRGGFFGSSTDDVRDNSETTEVFESVLSGFSFKLFRGIDPGDIDNGDIETIFSPDAVGEETNSFDKREAFVVADGAADFDDMNIGINRGFFDFFLDEVGKVGDELDGFSTEAAGAFFINQFFKNRARESNRVFISLEIEKAFVMTEVEVGFDAVASHKTFAMFNGV